MKSILEKQINFFCIKLKYLSINFLLLLIKIEDKIRFFLILLILMQL